MRQSKEQGVKVIFAEPVSQAENAVAIALLYYAKKNPGIVANKELISSNSVAIPGMYAAQILGKEKDHDMETLPADVFAEILDKCMKATLRCLLVDKQGKPHIYTAPYLPVTYIAGDDTVWFSFTEQPQCWFEHIETDLDGPYFQLKPLGGLLEFMRAMAKEYR